jgi:hypothetical protein
MTAMNALDAIPLWGIALGTVAVVLAALEAGYAVGTWQKRRGESKSEMSGAMLGATTGLLAIMMAFTFNGAATRHEARKTLVIEDVNCIERTWLRAGFLAEPRQTEIRRLLRTAASGTMDISRAVAQSDSLHDRM